MFRQTIFIPRRSSYTLICGWVTSKLSQYSYEILSISRQSYCWAKVFSYSRPWRPYFWPNHGTAAQIEMHCTGSVLYDGGPVQQDGVEAGHRILWPPLQAAHFQNVQLVWAPRVTLFIRLAQALISLRPCLCLTRSHSYRCVFHQGGSAKDPHIQLDQSCPLTAAPRRVRCHLLSVNETIFLFLWIMKWEKHRHGVIDRER